MDRSQRVRTYNFPENRISDHRVGYKAYNLDQVIDGDLDAVIGALDGGRPGREDRGVGRAGLMTLLLDEIAVAASRLAEAGVESPRADAELIAAHVHGVARGALHTVPDAAFDPRYWDDVARRASREPLQHITGQAYFRYLELEVGPGVFVPRPETEVMTGWAIEAAPRDGRRRAGRRRPRHRVGRDRAGHRPGGAGRPGARGRGRPARPAVGRAQHRPVRGGGAAHRGPGRRCTAGTSPARCRTWTARSTW